MATAKVTPFAIPTQLLPAVEKITQSQLSEFVETRNVLARLQERVNEMEENLLARLEAGAEVQPGVHVAELKEGSRRNVAWKEVAMRLAEKLRYDSAAYCSNVLAHTKPSRTVSVVVN